MELSEKSVDFDFFQAARERNLERLQECSDKGVDVNTQEPQTGNTALHILLGDRCFCDECIVKLESCLDNLLHKGADPNLKNHLNESPLERAVDNLVPLKLVKLLIHHGASILSGEGINNRQFMVKLIKEMPQVICDNLNQAVSFKQVGPDSQESNRTVQLDWRHLLYDPKLFNNENSSLRDDWTETSFLYDVVTEGTPEGQRLILSHPVVKAFLQLKSWRYWRLFGIPYTALMILTFGLYMIFTWYFYYHICKFERNNSTLANEEVMLDEGSSCQIGRFSRFYSSLACVILLLFFAIPIVAEYRKLRVIKKTEWLKQWQNYVFLVSLGLVVVTLFPLLSFQSEVYLSWQYPSASIAMLVGSVSLMIHLKAIPFVALNIEMLFKICLRIVLAGLSISPLVCGFFWAFRILLTSEENFGLYFPQFYTMIGWFELVSMVVNGGEFEDMLDVGRGLYYEIVAYMLFCAFIVLVIIVVLNFLIGIAVSDVEELKHSAYVTNLGHRVRSYYLLDIFNNTNEIIKGIYFHEVEPFSNESRLSQSLRVELLILARSCCCGRGRRLLGEKEEHP